MFRNGAPAEPFCRSHAGHSIEARRSASYASRPSQSPSSSFRSRRRLAQLRAGHLNPSDPLLFPLATLAPRLQVPSAPGEPELEAAMEYTIRELLFVLPCAGTVHRRCFNHGSACARPPPQPSASGRTLEAFFSPPPMLQSTTKNATTVQFESFN